MDCSVEGCKGKLVVGRVVSEDDYVEVTFVCDQDGDAHRFFTRVHPEDLCEDN